MTRMSGGGTQSASSSDSGAFCAGGDSESADSAPDPAAVPDPPSASDPPSSTT
ncbi:hypothetical protein HK102_008799 [Quaeritorhiza haematococci]|nr:hypothetical protein HK102_008799 [Quaeritorhiza haematococci]